MEILYSTVIPVLAAIVLVALVWLLVEVVMILRKARPAIDNANETLENVNSMVTQIKTEIEPTLVRIDPMVEAVEPAVARIDPLLEHLQLTVDAANLEIMRLDQILDDVSQITGVAGKAAQSVDTVTSAPAELVTGVAEKLRGSAKESARKAAAKRALESDSSASKLPGARRVQKAKEAVEHAADKPKTTIQAGSVEDEAPKPAAGK